ncbi:PASTA domain-containing protein [Actinophytocola oryzae]|uniref:PASTA domain-containing protein n=1 Tax=Actinophytocola oryzae TaxID=502181 RepID=A0A4R7W4I1_9PSEU|nr:PASTA domain-containing protein [Actinophytocola oryzae]TDV57630.1 hypothetical protein CLV71_101503 [Actinophytocola oryzae]
MRTIATIVCAVAVLTATAGCDGISPPGQESSQAPAPPAPPASTQPGAPTGEEPAQDQWTMPNLVGAVLQDAQDQIQQLTGGAVYFTDSHDLTGEGRNQVLDANWQVCDQNVPPGTALTVTSKIDFGVVKVDESCP